MNRLAPSKESANFVRDTPFPPTMRKTKILHIIKSLGRGGAEMLLPETLKLHDQSKFEFEYIYFLPWKDQMVSAIEKAGGKVTCISAKNNIELILNTSKVIDYCHKNQIDLIHCHLPWAGFLGRAVHARTGIPLIYTEHNLQERYHVITKTINRISFNRQTLAVGVSQDVSDSISKNIRPDIPVMTLQNGVNTDAFKRDVNGGRKIRREYGIPDSAIVIGIVAVFRFQKRIKKWLQVFNQINSNSKRVYGIVVGAGPLGDEIKAEAKRLGLEDKVFFPGLQTEMKPYFSAMDIFMMSSSFEGLPIALLEAMSMNCAVVTTDAGGIKEVIVHEKNGLLCDVEEWEKLAGYCEELITDKDKMTRLQQEARKSVITNFSLKKMVKTLEETYKKFSLNGN